jgi:hypothetical protein
LQALLEPTPSGHRLRLSTVKADARASIMGGLLALGIAAALTVGTAIAGAFSNAVGGIVIAAGAGLALLANGALRLPRWASLRGRQMEGIAARLASAPSSEQK